VERISQVYGNRRMGALAALGFASGLPYVLVTAVLQTRLADARQSAATIGLFSAVSLPYAFKFLWAPAMDRFVPPILGRRRGWLLVTQLALVGAIFFMAAVPAAHSLRLLAYAAVLVAFCSASQDIVSDAYRTDILPPEERGAGAAIFTTTYRVALLGASAGMMILVGKGWLSWRSAYVAAAAAMGVGVVASIFAPEPQTPPGTPRTLEDAVVKPLGELLSRRGALVLLAFVVLFKLPELLAATMTIPFLKEIGVSSDRIGEIRQGLGIAMLIAGALCGGAITARLPMRQCLLLFGILGAASNLGFCLAAHTGAKLGVIAAVIALENFCAGLVTAGFVAFLMTQCDVRYSAFQYALLSSLMFFTGVLAGTPAGFLAHWIGWGGFFAASAALGIPAIMMLPWISDSADAAPAETEPIESAFPVMQSARKIA
jgi:PAT family beta-lactamase induction signal transducer AmpG